MVLLFRYFLLNGFFRSLLPIGFIGYIYFLYSKFAVESSFPYYALSCFFISLILRRLFLSLCHKRISFQFIHRGLFAGAIISILFRFLNLDLEAYSLYIVSFCSFYIGYLFWIVGSEHYEMTSWILSPFEFDELPQTLKLIHKETVDWNGYPETCYLFKFTIDDEVEYGITGPITFCISDDLPHDGTPEEMVEAYKKWYFTSGVKKMVTNYLEYRD